MKSRPAATAKAELGPKARAASPQRAGWDSLAAYTQVTQVLERREKVRRPGSKGWRGGPIFTHTPL